MAEQLTLNQRVQGSSPCAPTKKIRYLAKAIQIASGSGVTLGVTIRRAPKAHAPGPELNAIGLREALHCLPMRPGRVEFELHPHAGGAAATQAQEEDYQRDHRGRHY